MLSNAMFERQRKFLAEQMPKYPKDMRTLHMTFCTHLAHEVHELMDCVPWKFHRTQEPLSREDLLEEMVDCQKLLLNVMLLHGVNKREFRRAFARKSDIVEKRALHEDLAEKVRQMEEAARCQQIQPSRDSARRSSRTGARCR